MKLVRFTHGKTPDFGILQQNEVTSLSSLAEAVGHAFPPSIEELIAQGAGERGIARLVRSSTDAEREKASHPLAEIALLAPIPRPPKIICLGLNYTDHAAEQEKKPPDEPVIFMKPQTAIIGPEDAVIKPSFVEQLDYEAELAVVIGRKTKNATASEAEACIFGFTILNDVSARDIQFKDRQWTRGKSFDTFAPLGPCITTSSQIGDPTNLRVRTWVNNELRQDSSTSNMVLNVYEIVQHLSRVMTLEPCDVIATGTPAGVGFAMKPQPKFLQGGDTIDIEIQKVGTLRNRVKSSI